MVIVSSEMKSELESKLHFVATMVVVLLEFSDLPPRVMIVQPCPDDFSVSADPGVTSLSVTWMEPTAINEGGQTVPVTTQSHFPGANFPVPSASTVSYIFSDRGASAMCNFLIITSESSFLF